MKIAPWIGVVLALGFAVSEAQAAFSLSARFLLDRQNRRLHGQVVDFTKNHGHDRRFWSDALQMQRDMYVYLPPGYDPHKQYPLAIWLHSFREDELGFLETIVPRLDKMMAEGTLPRMVVAAPDGSIHGRRTFIVAGSFFVDSKAGDFQQYIVQDVYNLVTCQFSVRPEPEAHLIFGASMGGGAAFNIAFKHPDKFRVIVGVFPPLNLRWEDCHGNYRANFDPCCWGWRTELRPNELVGRILGIPIRMWQLVKPIYGTGDDAIAYMSEENPIELLERLDIKQGQYAMYIAYAGKDQFNIHAQVESFLHAAHERGLEISVGYKPKGRHGPLTALQLMPGIACWVQEKLGHYDPDCAIGE